MAKASARTDETIDALRGRVIGNRVSIEMIAEINDQTVRAVYDNLQRHRRASHYLIIVARDGAISTRKITRGYVDAPATSRCRQSLRWSHRAGQGVHHGVSL